MFVQNLFSILSNNKLKKNNISEYDLNKIDIFLSKHFFNKDEIIDIYNFVSNNNLNPEVYKVLIKNLPIDNNMLEVSVFLPSRYFRALCKYSNLDLSFKNNSLLLHFLISMEIEEACFLMNFHEVNKNFNKKEMIDLVGEETVNLFVKYNNINKF